MKDYEKLCDDYRSAIDTAISTLIDVQDDPSRFVSVVTGSSKNLLSLTVVRDRLGDLDYNNIKVPSTQSISTDAELGQFYTQVLEYANRLISVKNRVVETHTHELPKMHCVRREDVLSEVNTVLDVIQITKDYIDKAIEPREGFTQVNERISNVFGLKQ